SLLPAAVIASLIGHIVEVSFAFHSVATGAIFWVVLGMSASFAPRMMRSRVRIRRELVPLGAAASLLIALMVVTPAVADGLYGAALRTNLEEGAQMEEQAAAWAPWVDELPLAAGLRWQVIAQRRTDDALHSRAERDLLEAARRAPWSPIPQISLTRLYLSFGNLASAEEACGRALANG